MLQACAAHRPPPSVELSSDERLPVDVQLQRHEAAARRAVVAQALEDLKCNSPEVVGLGSTSNLTAGDSNVRDTVWRFQVNACGTSARYDVGCSPMSSYVGCEVSRLGSDALANAAP